MPSLTPNFACEVGDVEHRRPTSCSAQGALDAGGERCGARRRRALASLQQLVGAFDVGGFQDLGDPQVDLEGSRRS